MKTTLSFFCVLLLATNLGVVQQQENRGDACKFSVQDNSVHPTVTGPADILPLVYVVEQPDSPLEIISVDLKGTELSVSDEHYTVRDCAKYRVHNRSDRVIQRFGVALRLNDAGGGSTGMLDHNHAALTPGQTAEVGSCNGGGHGGATGNHVRLVVSVEAIDFGECFYRPSLRIPSSLGIRPVW